MTEAQKNQSDVSAKQALLSISIPIVLVGAILTVVLVSMRKAY